MGDLLVHYRTSGQGLVKQLGNRLHLWLHRMPKWQPRAKRFHFERRWEDTSSFTSFGGSTSRTLQRQCRKRPRSHERETHPFGGSHAGAQHGSPRGALRNHSSPRQRGTSSQHQAPQGRVRELTGSRQGELAQAAEQHGNREGERPRELHRDDQGLVNGLTERFHEYQRGIHERDKEINRLKQELLLARTKLSCYEALLPPLAELLSKE
ncbi:hypothetical protein QOT17_021984 [Balamuthia mandrillaris]